MGQSASPAVVVTIGVFDGVHRGHQHIVTRAREVADAHARSGRAVKVVAMTFDPHPAAVLAPGRAPALLDTIARRRELLLQAGADEVVVVPFDIALSQRSPEQFIDEVVLPLGHVVAIVVGANFRFGHRAVGDVTTLQDLGAARGFVAKGLPLDGDADLAWSSTRARSLLLAGDVEAAAQVLGRPHRIEGIVGHGDKRGRELGYPTANLQVPAGMAVPADGVYAAWLWHRDDEGSSRLPAAVSIGTNPQFDGTERRVEAYVLDRDDLDLYDREVALDIVARLRGQMTFPDVAGLLAQMSADVQRVRGILEEDELISLMRRARTIAVVGASDDPERPSHRVADYLARTAGYEVYLVNPRLEGHQVLGRTVYGRLADLPVVPDVVDVFRRQQDLPEVLEEALAVGAPALWLQLGLVHDEVAAAGRAAGMTVVMDRCLKIEHAAWAAREHDAGRP